MEADPRSSTAARRRTPFRRVAALFSALPIGLVVAELALRAVGGDVVAPPTPGFYDVALLRSTDGASLFTTNGPLALELSPESVFRLRPGVATSVFRVNAAGFRGPELEARRAGRRRIVVLGASATFGVGLASDAETIAARIAARAPDAEVVNMGVPMFMCGQSLCQLTSRMDELAPDAAIYLDGWTDCMDWWRFPPRPVEDYGFNRHVLRIVEERLFEREAAAHDPWLMIRAGLAAAYERSAVVRALRRRSASAADPTSVAPPPPPAPAQSEADAEAARREASYVAMRDRFVAHVSVMRDLCAARGARFFVGLQPELGGKRTPTAAEVEVLRADASYAAFRAPWERFVKETSAALRARGATVVALSDDAALRDAAERTFISVVHPTAAGADRIASVLAPLVR